MRGRWQLSPRVSVLAALLIAAIVDGAIWIAHSGDSPPARITIPKVRASGPVDLLGQFGHPLLVGVGSDVAYFIMWDRNGNQVTGDMTEDLIKPGLDSTFTDTLMGTVHGTQVSVRLPGQGLGSLHAFGGHLTSKTLVMKAPAEPHGAITFHIEKDLKGYSKAVNLMLARQNANAGGG